MNSPLLRYSLFAITGYFLCMAAAHFFSTKLPLLFVYYDTPFYAYQDKIISVTLVSCGALFYVAARQRTVVPVALFVLGVTISGLASINGSEALAMVLEDGQSTRPYWIQTGLFAAIFAFLMTLYIRDGKAAP